MQILVQLYYLCIVNVKAKLNMSYKEFKKNGFDSYRKWFNKHFSLSYCGKFRGLRALGSKLDLFVHKLEKTLSRSKHQAPLGDVLSMSINGCKIKLYFR